MGFKLATAIVVDDSRLMRVKIKDILTKHNIEVIGEANNGIEAIKLYQKLRPDLMTLDILMPELDGLEVLKQIMASHSDAKVIIISCAITRERVMKALSLGAKNFIVKPFAAPTLQKAIDEII